MGRLDHSERQALIRRSFLFKDVPQPILERLATLSVTKHLDRRETLFNRGDEGDALYAECVGALFAHDLPAIEVIKWKEIFDALEHAIDECEDVSNVLESIALKNG